MNYLGIANEKLSQTAKALNSLLANYHVYYQNLRAFHWQIKGENFFELHRFFEELYTEAAVTIDEIAERILSLRFLPITTLEGYLEEAEIKSETTLGCTDGMMISRIISDHKILIEKMRAALEMAGEAGDSGTEDLISATLRNIEKKSWMLDAWQQKLVTANSNNN